MQLQLKIDICYCKLMKCKIELEEQNSLQSSTLWMHIIDYELIKVKNGKQPFKQNIVTINTWLYHLGLPTHQHLFNDISMRYLESI